MGHHDKQKSDFEKLPMKPKGNSLKLFWRLFKEFGRPYWMRLVMGVMAGMIMGGAMHLYLSFLDMGVSCLEAGTGGNAGKVENVQNNLDNNLTKRPFVRWVLKTAGIDLKKEAQEAETQQKEKKALPEKKIGNDKELGMLSKINVIAERFGLNVSTDDAVSFPLICVMIVGMLVFFAVRSFGEFINKYFLRWVGARIVADIRFRLFDNVQRQSMSFFDKTDVGRMISRCTYDAGVIDHAFSGTIAEAFIAPVQIIVAFEFLVLKSIQSGVVKPVIILVMLMPILLFPMLMLSKIVRDYQKKVLARVSVLVGIMQETFSGIRVVKAYNAETQEAARFEKHNAKYFKAVIKSVLADIFMQPSMQIVAIILGSIFLILCFRYNVSIGVLGVMGLAAQNAYRPIKELAKLNINLQKCAAAAERVFEALDCDTALPEPEEPVNIEQLNDGISFEHVSFSYNENEKVIDDFSLNVKKGQFVAIVGSTGSGKSTIANLLARFYDPQEGSVKLDGVNLKAISNANLRRIIGIVSQENFLFNDTIANNIKYGKPGASDEEIADAAKRANAIEFIEASPEGFGRNVGERGCQLSGGQRQRLAIARAILRNPPILILDEATSALDTETEQAVQDAIIQLMKERTVLAIAHRLSTVVNADKIVVLEQGHIVEQGTHDELYALNGRYRALYDMQVNATV